MSGLRTVLAGFAILIASNGAARAMVDLPREFAACAGRYSAMLEHAWLMQETEAAEYARLRAAFVSLLEAVDVAPGSSALSRRIEAKSAQAALLHAATFGQDADRAERAREVAQAYLVSCRRLLLDG